uniref:F-box and WD repeat domain containing 7 n=1 Tax=Homo sapiens TaxID=9606 RepID=A0A994J6F2_HUMAN
MCVPRSGLILSCICLYCGVLLPVLLPNLPFLTCLSMSTLESVTYLPEKGLYCQRLPSSRTHGGTESLKGKNTENMGFYGTLKMIFYKMKRKLDHGSEVRSFSLGKKPCKVSEYTSTTGLVPCSATPTTFGDLRAANGQGQQRRRITSVQPPTGLQEWLKMFQSWSGPEKLLALDELIDSCEPTQVKHMMQVIEPQFQRDFISLLPKELALYVLSFLEPKDLLQAAQTCRYWRILAEDNLLWREKCKEEVSENISGTYRWSMVITNERQHHH